MKLYLKENNTRDYVATYSMGYTGIYILNINYDIDDSVRWMWSTDYDKYGLSNENEIHESVIKYDFGEDEEYYEDWYDYDANGGRPYFMAGTYRIYLDECIRV